MVDVTLFTSGTPNQKPWLNLVSNSLTTNTLVAETLEIQTIDTNSLTLVEQKAVPNPAVGSITLFVDSATSMLNSQDSNGNTLPYVPVSGATMTGPLSSIVTANLLQTDDNGNLNLGSISTGFNNVLLGRNNNASNANELIIGTLNGATAQYNICIGNRVNTTQNGAIGIGGGNTGITNNNTNSVSFGNDQTLGAGSNCVTIGEAAGVGAVSEAISIGYQAVNNTSNSCLLGDTAIVNVRPNNASLCDLGSSTSPFKTTWLRDAAPASGCKYSQYGSVTVTNTAADTSLATGTHVGSLVLSANQTPGTLLRAKVNITFSQLITDSSTIRIKCNGNPLVAVPIGPGAALVTEGLDIQCEIVILGGGNAQCELRGLLMAEPIAIVNATSAWDQTAVNTLDFSIQFSAANVGDTAVCNFLYVETLFAQ
jgi:hypothetical protein